MDDVISTLKFNADGLIPAIVQDVNSSEVLMMAWMNEESLRLTVETGFATYWSRSRQKFWVKGETSGHVQVVKSISVDCDQDTILLKVSQTGAACHENYRSCFFRDLTDGRLEVNETPRLEG
jgi:phosphoribosyl-AMP cyclohydrolase